MAHLYRGLIYGVEPIFQRKKPKKNFRACGAKFSFRPMAHLWGKGGSMAHLWGGGSVKGGGGGKGTRTWPLLTLAPL